MRFQTRLLILCLLSPLGLAPLAAQTGAVPPVIRPGRVPVAVDPEALSYLPLDSGALRQNLCSGQFPVDDWGTISPRGECDLVVSAPPHIGLYVSNATPDDSSWRLSVQPVGASSWPAGAPVDTPCGLWEISMELDPDPTVQPVSEISLETSGTSPAQGVFAGVVRLAVRYRFVNRPKGISHEVPAVVPLELSGHWAALPPGAPLPSDEASNLVLFAGFSGGELLSDPTCGGWAGRTCPVCFSPSPDVLDTLNQGLH